MGAPEPTTLPSRAMADTILADKMARIKETGATVITSANPGCLLQLEAGLRRHNLPGPGAAGLTTA